jgi:surface polysaccharide O-acyltransferase-like enzyme
MTSLHHAASTHKAAQGASPAQIAYLNHLKVLLTVLVVLHHAFITYGAPGGWYYLQKTDHIAALMPMTMFVATNQSFFMGFFFFLSALFVESSYQKKGPGRFLADRLNRLGIPLLFYSVVLSPVLNYTVEHYGYGQHHSFAEYMSGYRHWVDFGVMWFVAALLLFNLIYLLLKSIPFFNFNITVGFPSTRKLLFAGLLFGLLTFFTRLVFHVGWSLFPLGFQLGHFPQYIALFIAGLIAAKNDWLSQLNLKQGKKMAYRALCMVLVVLPSLFIASVAAHVPGEEFSGGWNIISFCYSLWEQLNSVIVITALLSIAKFRWNNPSVFLNRLSQNAYGVYIFHPVVLISLSLLIHTWPIDPVIKLILVGPSAVVLSFLFVFVVRKIPLVNTVI